MDKRELNMKRMKTGTGAQFLLFLIAPLWLLFFSFVYFIGYLWDMFEGRWLSARPLLSKRESAPEPPPRGGRIRPPLGSGMGVLLKRSFHIHRQQSAGKLEDTVCGSLQFWRSQTWKIRIAKRPVKIAKISKTPPFILFQPTSTRNFFFKDSLYCRLM